ncbi:syntaxin-16 [Lepeophtheirus salmonis]|uniref:t-SNARE coiled-coil homology domain-containing protein n=1 Tax=Lepeophtheirus salmonis TaxID=72036 RepID=A0A0K2UT39_LEPSM|nr:syntaxin-16-like [Lepeophtheirus salmonis]
MGKDIKLPPSKCYYKDFVVMRNNAIQRKRFQSEQVYGSTEEDAEKRLLNEENEDCDESSIPSYVGQSEALNYQMTRVEGKVSKLDALHKRHLARPTLDDNDLEAEEIDKSTKDILSLFSSCHSQIKVIQRTAQSKRGMEKFLVENLVQSLGNRLQESTEQFRSSQNDYLKKINSREEKSNKYFIDFGDDDIDDPLTVEFDKTCTRESLLTVEHDVKFIKKREAEMKHITESIIELNSLFIDLAQIVSEQGTMIDRIDYNVENSQIKVEDGLKVLQKAAKYQKQSRKMKCILVLSVMVFSLFFILILKVLLE